MLPGAIALKLSIGAPPTQVIRDTLGIAATVLAIVVVFSLIQVRRGRWSHIDASVKSERWELNVLLFVVLLGAALVSGWLKQSQPLTIGLATNAAMVALILALRHWFKISLHTSFAIFASSLLWPLWPSMLFGAAFTIAIGWSRLVLGRHTLIETLLGGIIGAIAGLVFITLADQSIITH